MESQPYTEGAVRGRNAGGSRDPLVGIPMVPASQGACGRVRLRALAGLPLYDLPEVQRANCLVHAVGLLAKGAFFSLFE